MPSRTDREKVVAKTMKEPEFTAEQIGWRFALGTVIIVGSYAAWPLIPVVLAADLAPGGVPPITLLELFMRTPTRFGMAWVPVRSVPM